MYITWEQYSKMYDDITEAEFPAMEKKAEVKLDSITHLQVRRFLDAYIEDNATLYEKQCAEQITLTMAELIHRLNSFKAVNMGVSSVYNEGYSVSYAATDNKSVNSEIRSIIYEGLAGTGLQGVQ